jgi:hypothetical protein
VTPPFLSRQERFAVVGSTNDVVRGWLAEGTPEVCLAVADEQTAGRGRNGRSWQAPPGAALLLSLGFRPDWLEPEQVWRLATTVSLAMADAAEEVAACRTGRSPSSGRTTSTLREPRTSRGRLPACSAKRTDLAVPTRGP